MGKGQTRKMCQRGLKGEMKTSALWLFGMGRSFERFLK